MFVGRKAELAELERRYSQDVFQIPVLYGRGGFGIRQPNENCVESADLKLINAKMMA